MLLDELLLHAMHSHLLSPSKLFLLLYSLKNLQIGKMAVTFCKVLAVFREITYNFH